MEECVATLDEARRVIKELRERHRAQAHQMLSWRRRVKNQDELLAQANKERNEQLKVLSSQLLLFEARLHRKQNDIQDQLVQREVLIIKQQRIIQQLQRRLSDAGLDSSVNVSLLESSVGTKTDPDSLNDSDSAVIMEESLEQVIMPVFRSSDVKIVRSVSDAVECYRPTEQEPKYGSVKRYNGFLRRPEVLETVYSVEEDTEGNPPEETSDVECSTDDETFRQTDTEPPDPRRQLHGSYERLHQVNGEEDISQVTYNRVMSNHRSVTKPKDVKYKRINKAKSKSLEELRGRLRNWVDKGNKLAVSLDQSYA